MSVENWAPVKGFEGLYEVSDRGRIKRVGGDFLKGNINSYGYRVVKLTKDGEGKDLKVHRIVAMAFIPNDFNKSSVNHKDGNKDNNCVDNLEWVTKGENNRHAREVLNIDYSAKPVWQLSVDGEPLSLYVNCAVAAKITGVASVLIAACCKGTAKTAGDYCWMYDSGDVFKSAARKMNIERLSEKISQLQAEVERLKSEQL